VCGADVEVHEDALGLAVGLDAHEPLDECVEADDPVAGFAAVEQLGALGVNRVTRAPPVSKPSGF